MLCVLVFCFKQKTAYEMRISDWSSDVCSSDLAADREKRRACAAAAFRLRMSVRKRSPRRPLSLEALAGGCPDRRGPPHRHRLPCHATCQARRSRGGRSRPPRRAIRSEEHTSELQSLMSISYAVFCLKKKITQQPINTNATR